MRVSITEWRDRLRVRTWDRVTCRASPHWRFTDRSRGVPDNGGSSAQADQGEIERTLMSASRSFAPRTRTGWVAVALGFGVIVVLLPLYIVSSAVTDGGSEAGLCGSASHFP